MDFELLILNGYGQFIWPAYIFTFISCFFLYLKSKKEFLKQKKIYLKEFGKIETIKPRISEKEEEYIKGILVKKSI